MFTILLPALGLAKAGLGLAFTLMTLSASRIRIGRTTHVFQRPFSTPVLAAAFDHSRNIVVNASDATHVAEAIRFALKTRVRLIVKGGAHDLLGRYVPHYVGLTYRTALVDGIVYCVAGPRHLRRSPFGLGIS